MSDDAIFLVPYDEKWQDLAAEEIAAIRAAMSDMNFEIEHIGSTAVPGLTAKPIIDLLVGVDSFSDAAKFIEPLESMRYSYWRDNPKKGHFYFVKGLPSLGGSGRTHHVHIYEKGNKEFYKKLLFRNFLRAHSETANTYAKLKSDLANKYVQDRENYTDAKTSFIEGVIASAELDNVTFEIKKAKPPFGMTTKIIAIDGCGGAGKSTFADRLSTSMSG